MSLLLAAVGAVAAALLDLTIAPLLRIGAAQPDFVLIGAVVWTVVGGIEGGLVWAFVGGLMIDFLAPRPLGSTAFTLILCVGGAAVLTQALQRFRYLAPIVAVLVFSIVNELLFLATYGALRGPIPVQNPLAAILPDAIYNTLLASLVGLPAIAVMRRREAKERLDW